MRGEGKKGCKKETEKRRDGTKVAEGVGWCGGEHASSFRARRLGGFQN